MKKSLYMLSEGTPDVWIDGHLKRLKPGDGVGFPSGTGIAHTFLNNSASDVRLWLSARHRGSAAGSITRFTQSGNAEIGERHWKDKPERELGLHNGQPDKPR